VSKELPVWITTTQNPALWRTAAELNAHVLTALISLDLPTVGQRVREYRQALRELDRDPRTGIVSLMLHTYVAASDAGVRELVKGPLCDYLRSFLLQQQRLQAGAQRHGDLRSLIEEDVDAFIDLAFERYYRTGSLIGSPARCLRMLESVAAAGVDEIACLIDFGLSFDTVMEGLERLAALREQWTERVGAA
jgi:natural product biosynthesis luciferase-like monooxygenase protein